MIICIGISVFDIIFDVSSKLEENRKNQASGIRFNIGGNALNVAKALAHLGASVSLISNLASDEFGMIIHSQLSSLGIKASLSKEISSTPISAIINNVSDATRTILNYKDLSATAKIELPDDCSIIYSDGRFVEYTKMCRKKFPDASIVWDWERLEHYESNKQIVASCDILICSEDFINEMLEILGSAKYGNSEANILEHLYNELHFHSIVITKGSRGLSYSSYKDKAIKHIDAIDVVAVDTNAAGDVFHAYFIYHYLKTEELEFSLTKSNESTAKFVSKIGFFEAL